MWPRTTAEPDPNRASHRRDHHPLPPRAAATAIMAKSVVIFLVLPPVAKSQNQKDLVLSCQLLPTADRIGNIRYDAKSVLALYFWRFNARQGQRPPLRDPLMAT